MGRRVVINPFSIELPQKPTEPTDTELLVRAMMRKKQRAQDSLEEFYRMVIRHETTGVLLEPAPHQKLMFSFVEHHDRCVFRQPIGTGKCVTGSTLVVDQKTGRPRPIRDIVADPESTMVQAWDRDVGVYWAELGGKYNTGIKACLRVTTRTGRVIETTPEHPYMTPAGWCPAGELAQGGSVGVPSIVPGPAERHALLDAEVCLLALLFAEGSTTTDARFSTGDATMLKMAKAAAGVIGCDVKHRSRYDYAITRRIGTEKRNPAITLARDHGLFRCKAVDKRVPDAVFRLPDEQLQDFITIAWACDGTVSKTDASITLASEGGIDDIQHLLLRIGVQSVKRYKQASCDGKLFDSWRLTIRADSIHRFYLACIGLWGEKGNRLALLDDKRRNPNEGFAIVDRAFQDRFVEAARAKGVIAKSVNVAMGWSGHSGPVGTFFGIADRGDGRRSLSKGFAVAVAKAGLESEYNWLTSGDTYWDEVVDVEEIGDREVFDLTVPGPHCFIANDIIAHNTFGMAAVTLWLMGRDRTQRGALVSKTRGQASKVLSMVSDYITEPRLNARLGLVFPNLKRSPRPNDPWTQQQITVERPPGIRDPTLIAAGFDQAIAGARLSWLVGDDIVDDENASTKVARDKVSSLFDGRLVSRLDPMGSRAVVTNTPWDREDLTYHLENNAGWPTITMDIYGYIRVTNADAVWMAKALQTHLRPSTTRPGSYRLMAFDDPNEETTLWPDRYPLAVINEIRYGKGGKGGMLPNQFARLFLCEPFDPEAARCQREWIERCKQRGMGMRLLSEHEGYHGNNKTYTGIDLGIGKTTNHDRTVYFTYERLPDGSKLILDIESGRFDGKVIVDKLLKKASAYRSVTAVETNAAQDFIRQWAKTTNREVAVKAHTTGGANKRDIDFGVESIFSELQDGDWIIPCDSNGICEPEVQAWCDSMLYYQPPPAHTPDVLIACWIARERGRASGGNDPKPTTGKQFSINLNPGGF